MSYLLLSICICGALIPNSIFSWDYDEEKFKEAFDKVEDPSVWTEADEEFVNWAFGTNGGNVINEYVTTKEDNLKLLLSKKVAVREVEFFVGMIYVRKHPTVENAYFSLKKENGTLHVTRFYTEGSKRKFGSRLP